MRTIGVILKDASERKKLSRFTLEKRIKIKKSFIESLEKEEWDKLPEYPVIQGFVQNIADNLNLDKKQIVALLRRDYPPKKLNINPKPDIPTRFTWSPRLTFILGIAVAFIAILSYLSIQYKNFISPPKLTVDVPNEGQMINVYEFNVSGTTDPEASVMVNNQPALVDENGYFSAKIEIFEGTSEVVVIAKTRSGKETVIRRKIVPELGN